MGDRLANVRLVLFFTRGLSLRVWDEIGILDREAAISSPNGIGAPSTPS